MRRIYQLLALYTLLSTMAVGLLWASFISFHHHKPGCPFMPGEQAMCVMTVFDHISAWQDSITTTVSAGVIFSLIVLAVVHVFWITRIEIIIRSALLHHYRKLRSCNYYQELFSNGILNPKAP